MAGFDPNQPRNRQGEWKDAPEFGDDPSKYQLGRSKPNYLRPKEDYGKPRVSIQQDVSRNIGSQQRLPQTLKVKKVNSQTKQIERDVWGKPLYEMVVSPKGKMVAKTIAINNFSNLKTSGNKRRNQNIGKPPPGMEGPLGWSPWLPTEHEGVFERKPIPGYKEVLRAEKAHREALMIKQRNDRMARDALVDQVLQNPHKATYYRINKSRPMVTMNPVADKIYRGMNRTFKILDKWFK